MSLTVLLGCGACGAQQQVEVRVVERFMGDDGWHLHVDTTPLCTWRQAHRLPWARSA